MNSIKFTLYRKDTGEILCGGTSSSPDQLETDKLAVLIGSAYTDGWIDNDTWCQIPDSRPSPFHIFDYSVKKWVDPRELSEAWVSVRDTRNKLLALSDWTQLPDVPIATKEAWAIYRQALRDITDQPDPFNIVWPSTPN